MMMDPNGYQTEESLIPLINDLQAKWDENEIPSHHRVKFLELMKTLNPKNASAILAREIQDFNEKRAIVLKVILGIKAREECIRQIEDISQRYFSQNAQVTQDKIEMVRTNFHYSQDIV
jgi:hypothetical protein